VKSLSPFEVVFSYKLSKFNRSRINFEFLASFKKWQSILFSCQNPITTGLHIIQYIQNYKNNILLTADILFISYT